MPRVGNSADPTVAMPSSQMVRASLVRAAARSPGDVTNDNFYVDPLEYSGDDQPDQHAAGGRRASRGGLSHRAECRPRGCSQHLGGLGVIDVSAPGHSIQWTFPRSSVASGESYCGQGWRSVGHKPSERSPSVSMEISLMERLLRPVGQ